MNFQYFRIRSLRSPNHGKTFKKPFFFTKMSLNQIKISSCCFILKSSLFSFHYWTVLFSLSIPKLSLLITCKFNIGQVQVFQDQSTPKIKVFLKGCYTLDIFARDIAIKRYCDKKIILSHGCLKAKVSS